MSSPAFDDMAPRWPRPSEWPVWAVPLLIGVLSLGGSMGANWRATHGHEAITPLDPFGVLLLLAGPVLLLARRRHPVLVLCAVNVTTLLFLLRGYALGPMFLSLVVAIVTAVTAGHRLVTWLIAAVEHAAFFGISAVLHAFDVRAFPSWPLTVTQALTSLAWTLVILGGAEFVRIRSERTAEARHTRAEEQRRKASEERLRIARELHDVLAHNISMINVQAGVALHLMDERPEQARTALAAIKEASKEALTEMRSVIDVLRQGDEAAPRAPTAGLDRLDELVARARSAGLHVTCSVAGTRRPLPGGVDLAAFRIVQEALTNVTRHARRPSGGTSGGGAVTASIQVTYGDHDIIVQVDDNGRAATAPAATPGGPATGPLTGSAAMAGGGSGIPGMRERAYALGGECAIGPLAGGGFRVWARLPVAAEAEAAGGTKAGGPKAGTERTEGES
ncbi:MAG TPA: sensor histidine kinase [Streptosporangiaceae bacterium]|nr:sensor histidine kinase [Streptosporangiaceae bacterium]